MAFLDRKPLWFQTIPIYILALFFWQLIGERTFY